jgi:hypothetical protein
MTPPPMSIVRDAALRSGEPLPPELQQRILLGLVEEVHALRALVEKLNRLLILVCGVAAGSVGAQKLMQILGV